MSSDRIALAEELHALSHKIYPNVEAWVLAAILAMNRASAALRADHDAGGAVAGDKLASLLHEAEPTLLRQANDIVLMCPDGTITDDLFDELERAICSPRASQEGSGC